MTFFSDLVESGEFLIRSPDFHRASSFLTQTLGLQLEEIMPADDPHTGVFSGKGLRVRLERGDPLETRLRLNCRDLVQAREVVSGWDIPEGISLELTDASPPLEIPDPQSKLLFRRLADRESWIIGRAGMHYRDLVPGRLGGYMIASHIRIPQGGPVPDQVHFHEVSFQLIFCLHGWVRLVYEDQGEPFVLSAGDCVTQPPRIRHRVLEASDDLQVLEIGIPANHRTVMDHALELPTGKHEPSREFDGQVFCHHRSEDEIWEPYRRMGRSVDDVEHCDVGVAKATGNLSSVSKCRSVKETSFRCRHRASVVFFYVTEGQMLVEGQSSESLGPGDAFVIPPDLEIALRPRSGARWIEISFPGEAERDSST